MFSFLWKDEKIIHARFINFNVQTASKKEKKVKNDNKRRKEKKWSKAEQNNRTLWIIRKKR